MKIFIKWGIGFVVISLALFFMPFFGYITFWPTAIAGLFMDTSLFLTNDLFIQSPSFLGILIHVTGWFVLGGLIGLVYNANKK